jgi:hypothetical protein
MSTAPAYGFPRVPLTGWCVLAPFLLARACFCTGVAHAGPATGGADARWATTVATEPNGPRRASGETDP